MSTAQKIDGIKIGLIKFREEISQLETEETGHKGNAMSGINMALDNLGALSLQVEREAKAKAEADAKKLEEARKLVEAAAPVAAAVEVPRNPDDPSAS